LGETDLDCWPNLVTSCAAVKERLSVMADTVTFTVTTAGGEELKAELESSSTVLQLREACEKQVELQPCTFLKLWQNAHVLLDKVLLTKIDRDQAIYGIVVQETDLASLLQAAGSFEVYVELLAGAQKEGDNPCVTIGPFPTIVDVLEQMCGERPEGMFLSPGEKPGTLQYQGAEGDLLLPSLDGAQLLTALGAEKMEQICICVEVNSDAYNRGLGVVLEASPLLDATVDENGLPWYVYNSMGVSRDKRGNAVKFHPGMSGGQLRVEGVGGWHNQSIGFTPKAWTQSEHKYHLLELTLGADGENEVCIRGTDEGQIWRKPWTRQLFDGRYIPAVHAWLDLGGGDELPLQVGDITLRVKV